MLNEILVKPALAWIFCLLTGSLLLAAKSKTCTEYNLDQAGLRVDTSM